MASKYKTARAYAFDADDLFVVGLDKDAPDCPELLSEVQKRRLKKPLDPDRVKQYAAFGVLQSVTFKTVDAKPVIVDGRGRVRYARAASKILEDRGEPRLVVRGIPTTAEGDRLSATVSVANTADRLSPLDEAIEMALLADKYEPAQVAEVFGCGEATVKNRLKLLTLAPELRDAVGLGQITATAALKLADLDPDAQKTALADMIEKGATGAADAAKRARSAKSGGSASTDGASKPGAVFVRRFSETIVPEEETRADESNVVEVAERDAVAMSFAWLRGEVKDDDKALPAWFRVEVKKLRAADDEKKAKADEKKRKKAEAAKKKARKKAAPKPAAKKAPPKRRAKKVAPKPAAKGGSK